MDAERLEEDAERIKRSGGQREKQQIYGEER